MESLEKLKAIVAGKPNNAQSVMMVCNPIYLKIESDRWYAACKGQDWIQITDKQVGLMRSIDDIEKVIEQKEMLEMAWQSIGEAGYEDHCNELRNYMEAM